MTVQRRCGEGATLDARYHDAELHSLARRESVVLRRADAAIVRDWGPQRITDVERRAR